MRALLLVSLAIPLLCQSEADSKCPACQNPTILKGAGKTNNWGGIDYDGAIHSHPNAYYASKIQVCGECFYTAGRETFCKPPSKEKLERIVASIRAMGLRKNNLQPDQIAALFTTTMLEVAAADKERVDANLTAAFFLRESSWKFPEGYVEVEDIVKKYGLGGTSFLQGKNQAVVDVDKCYSILKAAGSEKDEVQQFRMKFVAAIFMRKHGEIAKAAEVIKSIQAGRADDSIIDDCLKTTEKFISEERKYLERAAAALEPGILRVEMLREIGETETAAKELDQLIKNKDNSKIKQQLEEIKKRVERK